MVKHILGSSIFQSIVIFVFVFAGHTFIPEGVEGLNNTDPTIGITADMVRNHSNPRERLWTGEYVQSGMIRDFDGDYVYLDYELVTPSRHLTCVFNLFVFF